MAGLIDIIKAIIGKIRYALSEFEEVSPKAIIKRTTGYQIL